MSRFFLESDFEAYRDDLARSNDEKIISNRMFVVEKLRDLHEQGLKKFMNSNGLYEHWQKQHLTSVVWPLKQANGEYVNYVRMGYGKSKQQMKELSKILGLTSINDKGYMKDDMAFHYVTQLQIALDEYGWNIALYLGDKGWLEQRNLVKKIESSKVQEESLIEILRSLQEKGFILYIHLDSESYYFENAEDYLTYIVDYSNKKVNFRMHICKELERDSEYNDLQGTLQFIIKEFNLLMPLYKFVAWDSTKNNYL
jgi:hypothetical protein